MWPKNFQTLEENHRIHYAIIGTKNETMGHSSVDSPENMCVSQEPNNKEYSESLTQWQCLREPMSSMQLSPSKQFTICKKRSHCATLQLPVFKACLPLSWDVYFLPLPLLSLSVKRTRQVKQVTSDWISIFGNRRFSWGKSRFKSSWALPRGAMATEQAQKWLNQVKFAGHFNSLLLQINK